MTTAVATDVRAPTLDDHLTARLSQVRTLDEVKALRDEVAAFALYARRARKGLAVQNRIALAKALIERKAGELLLQMKRSKGGRPPKTPASVAGVSAYQAALEESGIAERTAERWQLIARFLDEGTIHAIYQGYVADAMEFTGGVLETWASWRRIGAEWAGPGGKPPGGNRLGVLGGVRGGWWSRPVPSHRTLRIDYDTATQCRRVAERLDRVAHARGTGRGGAVEWLLDRCEQKEEGA
jgi:hypothetical protein